MRRGTVVAERLTAALAKWEAAEAATEAEVLAAVEAETEAEWRAYGRARLDEIVDLGRLRTIAAFLRRASIGNA